MAEVSIDPRIHLRPSPSLLNLLSSIPDTPPTIRLICDGSGDGLDSKDIQWIKQNISKDKKIGLYDLLVGCSLVLPTPVYPERNPLLEKRCAKLRIQQEDRDYRAMTRNIRESKTAEKPLNLQFKELNSILVMLAQFVISVGASFMFGYLAPYYLYGREDPAARILFGFIVAFFVGIADLYFVIREHLSEDGIRLKKMD